MDDKLDKLLKKRKFEPCSKDFADNIIMQAKNIEQKPSIWKLINSLFIDFHIPRPAYSMASVAILSLIIGFNINTDQNNIDEQEDLYNIIYNEEDIL